MRAHRRFAGSRSAPPSPAQSESARIGAWVCDPCGAGRRIVCAEGNRLPAALVVAARDPNARAVECRPGSSRLRLPTTRSIRPRPLPAPRRRCQARRAAWIRLSAWKMPPSTFLPRSANPQARSGPPRAARQPGRSAGRDGPMRPPLPGTPADGRPQASVLPEGAETPPCAQSVPCAFPKDVSGQSSRANPRLCHNSPDESEKAF